MNPRATAGDPSGIASGQGARETEALRLVCAHCATINRVLSTRLRDGPKCGDCKQPLLTGRPFELTQGSFDRHVANTDLPLVVDFWAPWCGPCRMMAPAYEQAATRLETNVLLAKLNTETEPDVAARFGIRSIPTLIAFRNGREAARQSGAMDLPRLVQWITANA